MTQLTDATQPRGRIRWLSFQNSIRSLRRVTRINLVLRSPLLYLSFSIMLCFAALQEATATNSNPVVNDGQVVQPNSFKSKPAKSYVAQASEQAEYAAIWEQSSGPARQARNGLTSAQYQSTFDQLVSQGYRLIQVSGYSVNGQDLYAAIWEQSSGPARQARHGLTSAQYQSTFNQLVSQGYRLVDVSGYSVNGQDLYAAIWEQSSGPARQARHGLTSAQYQSTFNQLVSQGYRLVDVSGYSIIGH